MNCTHRFGPKDQPCAACKLDASNERDQLLLVARELNIALLNTELSFETAEQRKRAWLAINASRLLVVEIAGAEFARGETDTEKAGAK